MRANLDVNFAYLLFRLSTTSCQANDAAKGVKAPQSVIEIFLDEFGPSSQAELGRCTAIDRSDVAAAVNSMVERGFARRDPDPADGGGILRVPS